MPELPEVETVRRGLADHLDGARIADVELRRKDLRFPLPRDMRARLCGRRVLGVDRRAKYLLVRLSDGLTLLAHLGMSGFFTLLQADEDCEQGPHDHVVLHLEDERRVIYTDPRRFGIMDLLRTGRESRHKLLGHLGPEPLDDAWDADALCDALRGRRTSIKAALLDQETVVGVGNIYACEALFQARISPRRLAASVAGRHGTTLRARRLVSAVKSVLAEAIRAGGSTLRDFRSLEGELGYFAHSFQVYDQEDASCVRQGCDGRVRRIVQSGRSTFYCSGCQG